MAIRFAFTDDRTGAVYPAAHLVVSDPVMKTETKQVWLQAFVYATEAAYETGLAPVRVLERVFPMNDYGALRTSNLNLIEPVLINRYFGGGARTPD